MTSSNELNRIHTETFGLIEMNTNELALVEGGNWLTAAIKYVGGLIVDALVVEGATHVAGTLQGGVGPNIPPHLASGHAACDNV